jgi:hypothetical protein
MSAKTDHLPAPLTDPDCDLRDFAFMPLDAARVLDSDLFALTNGEEFKCAFALWCKAWLQIPAGSLPNDDRVLAFLSGAGSRWKRVKPMALRGFVECNDGRLYHSVVCEKANEAWAKKQSFRDRSRKGNEKRWGAAKDSNSESLKDTNGIAKGLLEPPKGQRTEESIEDADASSIAQAGEDQPKGEYVFAGRTIKINQADFDRWRSAYHAIGDLRAELQALDDWFDSPAGRAKRDRWFHVTSSSLGRKHQELLATPAAAGEAPRDLSDVISQRRREEQAYRERQGQA